MLERPVLGQVEPPSYLSQAVSSETYWTWTLVEEQQQCPVAQVELLLLISWEVVWISCWQVDLLILVYQELLPTICSETYLVWAALLLTLVTFLPSKSGSLLPR